MTDADPALIETASEFAAEVGDLLDRTVVDEPPIGAQVADDRVVVGAFDHDGNTVEMALAIQGEHRLDLRVSFRCTFDITGSFLAIDQSEFALIVPAVRHPVVRFDYVRERAWASAHVQLHAESSAIGFLRAHAGKSSETWRLHLPVGGRRFRPSLEDVIEFRSLSSTSTRRTATPSASRRDENGGVGSKSRLPSAMSSGTTPQQGGLS